MPQYVFTVAAAGQLCLLQGGGSYTIKRKQADGKFSAYNVNGRTLSIGSANTCAVIMTPGDYQIDYTLTAIKCDAGANPVFQYTEGAGASYDGVTTGMSFSGGVLTLTRSNGLPNLTATIPIGAMPVLQPDGSYLFSNGVDPDVVISKPFVPSDPAAIDDLMLAIKASAYGKVVNNAFGVAQHVEIQIPL
jgi:hypothetical protein